MKIIVLLSIILSGCANIEDYTYQRELVLHDNELQHSLELKEHLDIEVELRY